MNLSQMPSNSLTNDLDLNTEGQEIKSESVHFQSSFEGYMEMYSDAQTVAEYLDAHEGWFCRCAHPMKVESLGDNGYTLTVGRFNSLGYEVEPKISVVLQPAQDNVYKMHTITVPDAAPLGYDVDYQASLELAEIPTDSAASKVAQVYTKKGSQPPEIVTQVKWQLHLGVKIDFPKFIYKLPLSLIQSTGDRLLGQIIRQVSPRLTEKVQKDFHSRLDLPTPPKSSRKLQKMSVINSVGC